MTERMLHHEVTRGRGWIYGDPIEGYILTRKDGDMVDIIRLGVTKGSQGKGIGKTLLELALFGASDVLLTVKKTNLPAIKLYQKYGFIIVAHLQGANSWVMRFQRVYSA